MSGMTCDAILLIIFSALAIMSYFEHKKDNENK